MNSLPDYRRILLSRLRFIGDVVLSTPLIRSVRSAYPKAYIAYLGEKNAVSLLEHHPLLDAVIPYDFDRSSLAEQVRIALFLRRRKFDLAIDLVGNSRSALLVYLSGANVRIGIDRRGWGWLFTIRVRDFGVRKTVMDFQNQFLRAAGIPPMISKTEMAITDAERRDAAELLRHVFGGWEQDPQKALVGIHPGASWPAKQWLADRFGLLGRRLATEIGATVIATGG